MSEREVTMEISSQDIKNNINALYYKRGVSYYSARRVLSLTAKELLYDNGDTYTNIISMVKGSGGTVYRQDIDIFYDKSDIVIDGNCSCPMHYNCKHIAAACIEYKSSSLSKKAESIGVEISSTASISNSQSLLLDKWLYNLKNSSLKESKPTQNSLMEKGEYFLTYRLDGLKSYDKNRLSFYKSKILKNGSISKGTKLDASKVPHDYSYSELKNSQDKDILKLASALLSRSFYASDLDTLSGSLGAMIVSKVIETGRCYFDYHANPLAFIEGEHHVEFAFRLYKGEYSLKSNLDKKELRVIETSPAFVLDTLNDTVQKIDIDIEIYKEMLQAPKIPKEDIGTVYESIATTLPNLEIETPKSIAVKKIETKPIPRLSLADNSLKVDFKYEEYWLKYAPQKSLSALYENGKKIEVRRDLAFEALAKERVESFGFDLHLKDDNLLSTLSQTNRQEQLTIWKSFLSDGVESLKNEGWLLEINDAFSMQFEASSEVVVESEEKNDWFSLSFNLEFNGVSQPIVPLVTSIINEFDNFENMPEFINVEVEENHFVEVQTQQIAPIIKTIIELLDKKAKDNTLKISPYDAHLLDFMDDAVIWRGSKEILELSSKLKDFKGIKKVKVPKALTAELREYQQEGLNWLHFLYEFKFGGILADDMGLGKTIQTLTHLSWLKENNKLTNPSLVVMPTSLIANWKKEAAKFTPNLRVLSLHGSERAKHFESIEEYDVLLTTYPLIVRDQRELNEHSFMYIILDEAQKIKNHKTKMAQALKTLTSEYRLALSGTPIENHLGELWSIFSFLMPGFLDTMSFFRTYYQTPIEKEHNFERQNLLNKRIKPFMLRRTKEKVAKELPAKSEIIKYTQFGDKQSKLYESIRVTMEKKVQEAVEAKGIGSSHITILDALLKLRQVCCDPSLLKIQEAQKLQESAKLELFLDLVDELLAEGRKILVFSQFTSMLAIIEKKISDKKIKYSKLTGSTRKREEAIDKFTQGDASLFLISLKAGGVGLNLVEADTVIHYDPWWNPAVENQATDRAYRIGQKKAVFVYKLIVENSIEQKILEMQSKKKSLQDGIYDSDKQQDDIKFSGNELLELLK